MDRERTRKKSRGLWRTHSKKQRGEKIGNEKMRMMMREKERRRTERGEV